MPTEKELRLLLLFADAVLEKTQLKISKIKMLYYMIYLNWFLKIINQKNKSYPLTQSDNHFENLEKF